MSSSRKIFELTNCILQWLEEKYPGKFVLMPSTERFDGIQTNEIYQAAKKDSRLNNILKYDLYRCDAIRVIENNSTHLFRSDLMILDAYATIKAADPDFFDKIDECAKEWLQEGIKNWDSVYD
jgi:hypothetical protein